MESKPGESLKFLYSYGGKILPRSSDGELRYVGGHTRVLTVDRSTSFSELMVKLVELCVSSVTLRCQLPNGDLETLISITSDEDLRNVIEEYDRASSKLKHPLKIRTVLSPPKSLNKASTATSSSSSSATLSPSRSPHTSAESLPYAVAHRLGCNNRSPRSPIGFPIGVRAKSSYYMGQGSPRSYYCGPQGSPRGFYCGPYRNNYCH